MYEPLAIVGTACRFPGGANTPSKLWELLKAPRDVLKEFAPDRLGTTGFHSENPDRRGRTHILHKSYLLEEDTRLFDNAFFDTNPKDAADMDPQQRVLLETVYEAFESAGWSLNDVDNSKTSVHVGVMTDDYLFIQGRDPETLGGHAATGISRSILANRLSYAFNLKGASLALDTACSSSLVALHLAAQGLQRGEATAAVVAGTNLLLDSAWYIMGSSMHMISPESRSRMWDKDANGYARGEGCAAVVLKTLAQAIRDNDHIECIIRGTGVNSDGYGDGNGITMPSPAAQTALIRQTYRDCGLDPVVDRCQYFECHGTGTQAGDPSEARAIRDAFNDPTGSLRQDKLLVGSIKTVIGHTEGCAGVAGIMKASLAIQNKTIPPNMLFQELNPKIEPFYDAFQIPTSLTPWPETGGGPRRASVNSFGFGGTNAHAILESYEPSDRPLRAQSAFSVGNLGNDPLESKLTGPFFFSARSNSSLANWLRQLLAYLQTDADVNLDLLSNTVNSKRSVFRYRAAIPAAVDRTDLIEKLEDQINIITTQTAVSRSSTGSVTGDAIALLGVFTGQGAQAARMGLALMRHSELFRNSISQAEDALASIPESPTWSLSDELAADTIDSRIAEAEFSQPLCTAIQIGLVDLLNACGISFEAVVGHSSGEIGAAYAAGLLTKRDAMGIAYYRGRVTHLARGQSGQQGAMMAASMSFEAAQELCSESRFQGRIVVAASNSPSSVTFSGDTDAISEMKKYLDLQRVTARRLQVDTAYHSHHMGGACAEAYTQYLETLNVTIQTPPVDHRCHWYSSVRPGHMVYPSSLQVQYWVDNLTHPVLFSQAVQLAVQSNSRAFTAAIEVGPHAALKGPVNQTLKHSIAEDRTIPYTSCLSRGKNAIETFSDAFATIWSLAPSAVILSGWRQAFQLPISQPPMKNLPPYAWDHTQLHWRESRVARNYRLDTRSPHDLLGRLWNDCGSEQTWRNILRLSEMPWLNGHVFQSQVLFPAAGYISMAIDAAKVFVKDQRVKLIEVHELDIPRALPIGTSDEVDILFTIRSRPEFQSAQSFSSTIKAEFTCYSFADQSSEPDKTCQGQLTILLGEPDPTDLAPTHISDIELTPFNVGRFYHAASEIGFSYNGPFRALNSLNKCWGHAKSSARWSKEDPDMKVACSLHPAILDNAFQTGLSTILSAAENSMHSPYLPIGVKRALIDPNQDFNDQVEIEAYMTSPVVGLGPRILTDINIKTLRNASGVCGIQLEGVTFKALSEPQPSEDRNILAKTVWGHDAAYGLISPPVVTHESLAYTAEDYERVALFHLLRLSRSISAQEMEDLQPHHRKLIKAVSAIATTINDDRHQAFLQPDWLHDTADTIQNLMRRGPMDPDMSLMNSGFARMQSALKGSSLSGRESQLYGQTTRSAACHVSIAQMMAQISHTFPRTNILHVSGGNIDAIFAVLDAVGDAYQSYTCADSSATIVEEIRQAIGLNQAKQKRILFDVFDGETTREREVYDVIIVSDICRPRKDVAESIRLLRELLRPGGYLISMELTGPSLLPLSFLGSCESWWETSGSSTGIPGIKTGEWDTLLSSNGFSGIEGIFHDDKRLGVHGYSVFAAQALDDRMAVLHSPQDSLHVIKPTAVVIIGGASSVVSTLIRKAKTFLRGWAPKIQTWSSIDSIGPSQLPLQCSVINLQELDEPLFSSPPSVNEIKNLHTILETAQNILWVTSGRLLEVPHANIMMGIGRALRHEHLELSLQFLDFEPGEIWDIATIVNHFLRQIFASSSPNNTDGLLWVREAEIVIRDSNPVTPRVIQDSNSNELYNAGRRRVTKSIGPAQPIELVHQNPGEPFFADSPPLKVTENHLHMEVRLSVKLHAGDEKPCYLSYGRAMGDNGEANAFAISNTDSSIILVDMACLAYSSGIGPKCDPLTLLKVANFLIASHIVFRLSANGTTLVHGASESVAQVISALATDSGKKVEFIAVSQKLEPKRSDSWIRVHPKLSSRAIRKIIPGDAVALINLSNKSLDFVLQSLSSSLPTHVLDTNLLSQESVERAIESYVAHSDTLVSLTPPRISKVSAKIVPGDNTRLSVVTDWKREGPIEASIRALDPHTLISPNKTYFLVGMASELGQSLAYFLVRGGARYIVLSSRNPKSGQRWLHDLRTNGVDIRVVKMDVTDHLQVIETVKMIDETMPPIGGVTNAALVLEPAVFANLSAASIAKQMMPKINGTVNLDVAFKDHPLDFFMCFGSLGTTFGNPGHAIYHAGNAFMNSFVANRKKRGLVGSILNFGMLVDVGYVARADRDSGTNDVEDFLRGDGLIALSEADFHHVILEGIRLGNPDCPYNEVIMGTAEYLDNGQGPRPRWLGTANLSHFVRQVTATPDDDAPSSGSYQSQLDNATTVEEALPPITELLSQKIKAILQVSLDSIHPDEPLSRLGIDSINAIEIRKWLLEKFKAEISMVQILGRDASRSIIRAVAEQYLAKRPVAEGSKTKHGSNSVVVDERPRRSKIQQETKPDVQQRNHSAASTVNESSPESKVISTPPNGGTPATSSVSSLDLPTELDIVRSEPLSVAQKGLLYLDKFSETRTTLNLTTSWLIKGPLDAERLNQAFERTVNRHDSLRTCFFASSDDSDIQQHVKVPGSFQISQLDSSAETAEFDVLKAFNEMKDHEYSLDTGHTLRATLIRHGPQSHTLIIAVNNLVIDVVSFSIIFSDIAREYQLPLRSASRITSAPSYLDYTRQQMADMKAGRLEADTEYWASHLDPMPDILPLLPVAKVKERQNRRAYRYHSHERELSSEIVQSVTRISRDQGVTTMQFYLAALQVFLCRILNINDLVIGITHTGRDPINKFWATVGHLATILPVRFRGVLNQAFPDVLKATQSTLLDSLDHAFVPFTHIVDKIRPAMVEGNMPLIQVSFNYTVDDSLPSALGDCSVTLEQQHHTTVYDFVLDVQRSPSGNHMLGFKCTDDFYSSSATQLIAETFFNVLEILISNPLTAVKDCRLFTSIQLKNAKAIGHTPALHYGWPESLIQRFNEVVAQVPDSIAIKDDNRGITYRELNGNMELYASILVEAKVTAGSRVAVFCKPSVDLYTAMLAIWHIGAIFVPLDVSLHAARRHDILKSCRPHALVFHNATVNDVEDRSNVKAIYDMVYLNISELAQARRDILAVPRQVITEQGAVTHMLFTSGSTGKPKGIKLSQRGIMNLVAFISDRFALGQVRVLQQTSIGFDVSFSQVFTALANGGTLVVAPFEIRGDPDMLSKLILEEAVEWTMCTPSEYNLLLTYAPERMRECKAWRFAGAGGEVLSDRVVDGFRELKLPNLTLTNWYGPTEVTVATGHEIPVSHGAIASRSDIDITFGSLIGNVVPNTTVYILDEENGTLLPPGMPGEICVGGVMVAPGYLDSSLDAGTFVQNPYASPEDVERGFNTMYRTGDRGILRQDGSVIFLGRTQRGSATIKLRGLRIDLNEVEGAILGAAPADLAEATVTVRGDPQFLVSHVALKPGRHLNQQKLTALLQNLALPRYMIPAAIVRLDRLPRVPNGKIDLELLRRLPLPEATETVELELQNSDMPLTELEERLRTLWVTTIGEAAESAEIAAQSSFLAVGGDSLLLIRLQRNIDRDFGVRISLPEMWQAMELRDMASVVSREQNR